MDKAYFLPDLRRNLEKAKKLANAEENDYVLTLLEALNELRLTTADGDLITSYIQEAEARGVTVD